MALLILFPVLVSSAYVQYIGVSLTFCYSLTTHRPYSYLIYESMLLPILFLENCCRNLHRLMYFSLLAILLMLSTYGIFIYYIFGEGKVVGEKHNMIGKLMEVPIFIGHVMFCFQSISVYVAIEENMKTPGSFLGNWGPGSVVGTFGTFNTGVLISLILYGIMGTCLFVKYGSKSTENILLSLPPGSVRTVCIVLFTVSILFSYPLQCFPVFDFIWYDWFAHKVEYYEIHKRIKMEYIFRFLFTLFTVIIAMAIPFMDIIVSVVGVICLVMLGLFFPSLMEYTFFKTQLNTDAVFPNSPSTIAKDVIIMTLSIILMLLVVICVILAKAEEKL